MAVSDVYFNVVMNFDEGINISIIEVKSYLLEGFNRTLFIYENILKYY